MKTKNLVPVTILLTSAQLSRLKPYAARLRCSVEDLLVASALADITDWRSNTGDQEGEWLALSLENLITFVDRRQAVPVYDTEYSLNRDD
jgi:hypothetical protein